MNKIIWSTKRVEESKKKLDDGYLLRNVEIPYFEKVPGLRKSDLTFSWTQQELDEYVKCKLDIHYFANNYVCVKSEDGSFKPMRLRDYQYDILNLYDRNSESILMSSRQTGKCSEYTTTISIYDEDLGTSEDIRFFKFLFIVKPRKTIYDYLKYSIYSIISFLDR